MSYPPPSGAIPWRATDEPDPAQAQLFSDVDQPPVPEETPRFVMLFSWWKSRDGKRSFAVVDKITSGTGSKIQTNRIKLLEVGDSNPFYLDIEEFWKLVDRGSLVEQIHDALSRSATLNLY